MNKEALEKLIQDVELQLEKSKARLTPYLSKDERDQVLAENQAIENTIDKLQAELKNNEENNDIA